MIWHVKHSNVTPEYMLITNLRILFSGFNTFFAPGAYAKEEKHQCWNVYAKSAQIASLSREVNLGSNHSSLKLQLWPSLYLVHFVIKRAPPPV